jgi:hypothetical protein
MAHRRARGATGSGLLFVISGDWTRPCSKSSSRLLIDIHDVWEVCGRDILFRLARDEPGKLASIAYGLLPKDVFIQVQQQPTAIDPEQWELLVGIARTMKEVAPDASLPEIESALRSAFAKPVLDASNEVGTPRPMGGKGIVSLGESWADTTTSAQQGERACRKFYRPSSPVWSHDTPPPDSLCK